MEKLEIQNLNFHYSAERIKYKDRWVQTYCFGNGEKVIFAFPSFPHSGFVYQLFTRFYDQSKFRFITFDMPGWGGWSENIFDKENFDPNEYINIATEIVKHYKLQQFSLIGYSFGGAMAVKFALNDQVKDKITKVALVSSIVNAEIIKNSSLSIYTKLAYKLGLGKILKRIVMNDLKKSIIVLSEYIDREMLEEYWNRMNHSDPKILLESAYYILNKVDCKDELIKLASMNYPFMIANSKTEPKLFRQEAEYLRKIFSSEKTLFLNGEHYDFILRPKSEKVAAIMEFLLK